MFSGITSLLHMDTQASYDRVADEYVRHIFDELRNKPLDRQLLDRFAASVRDVGLACDLGAGLVMLLVTCISRGFRFVASTSRRLGWFRD